MHAPTPLGTPVPEVATRGLRRHRLGRLLDVVFESAWTGESDA